MGTFSYFNVPIGSNAPKNDQPNMLTNAASISSLIDVDHVSFNVANGGYHKQVTFNSTASPSTPSGLVSIGYTAAGVADNTKPQLMWKNSAMTIPVAPVKAWGCYTVDGSFNITAVQSTNINSVTRSSQGVYAVIVNSGVITGSGFGIQISSQDNGSGGVYITGYRITGTGTFNLYFSGSGGSLLDPKGFTFSVIQV